MSANRSAVRDLCEFLHCDVRSLKCKLENPSVRDMVEKFLADHHIYTTYKIRTEPLKFSGITQESARYMPAYDGFKRTNVDQHYYSKYRINLRYPWLQCVMEPRERDGYSYFPLELLKLVPKPKDVKSEERTYFPDPNYSHPHQHPPVMEGRW